MRHAFGWCRRRRDQCLDVVLWHRVFAMFACRTAGAYVVEESYVSNSLVYGTAVGLCALLWLWGVLGVRAVMCSAK